MNITEEKAAQAYETIMNSAHQILPDAKLSGVTVIEMAPAGGTEFIVGFTRKNNFGTVIIVGMGGTFVEIMKDIAFGIAPLSKSDARRMISLLRFSPVLAGFRGKPALDVDVLIDCLGRVSELALAMPQIRELDINPLILYPKGQGAKVVDIRLLFDR